MERFVAFAFRFAVLALLVTGLEAAPAGAETMPTPVVVQPAPVMPTQPPATGQFAPDEIIDTGHHFFGSISRGLATVVEKAVSQWGLPNGYILGEEAVVPLSAAFVMATESFIPRMPATCACTGRDHRSASMPAPTAGEP